MVETQGSALLVRSFNLDGLALVDRDPILQELDDQFSGRAASLNVCYSIEGGWGMGKSALLESACQTAARLGATVIRVHGDSQEHAEALRTLRHILDGVRAAHDELQGIEESVAKIERAIARDGERGVEALGTSLGALLELLTERGPVLVAVDDADVVDDATMETLSYLCQRSGDAKVWLLVTTSTARGAATSAIGELLVRHFVRHVELPPLSHDAIREVVAQLLNVEARESYVEAIREATNGRPEFVVALVIACRDEGLTSSDPSASEFEHLHVPRLARQVLARYARLSSSARTVLELGAVGGSQRDVVRALGLQVAEMNDFGRDLQSLWRAELLEPETPYEFVAPIVRWAVLNELTPDRRSELDTLWAHYLDSVGGDVVTVARHGLATVNDWDDAVTQRVRRAVPRLLDIGEAELAAQCLHRLMRTSAAREASSLWLDLARCELLLGHESAVSSFQEALARGARIDDTYSVALDLIARLSEWPEVRSRGVALLQSLSRQVETVDAARRVKFELGLSMLIGHPAKRNVDVARIERCLKSSDVDSESARLAKLLVDVDHLEKDRSATASDIAERFRTAFVASALPVGDHVGATILLRVSRTLLHGEHFEVVDEFLEVARRQAYAAGDTPLECGALRLSVLSNLWQGSLERADEALGRHDELADARQRGPVPGSSELLINQDRLDEAIHRFAEHELTFLNDPLEYATALVERGRILSAWTRADEAVDVFMRAKTAVQHAELNLDVLVAWRPSMAEALAALGHWDQAVTLASEHLVTARSFGARRTLGVALQTMAHVTRDADARADWLSQSIEVLEGSAARLALAEALFDLGVLMGERGESERARELLDQSAALAALCKAARLVRLATSHVDTLGSRRGRAGEEAVIVYS